MTVASLSVPLVAPATTFSDRINQLDLAVGKWITFGKVRVQPEATVLSARVLRIGLQVKF